MRVIKYGLLALVLLQLPFVYRVCQTHRLHSYLEDLHQKRDPESTPFRDLAGTLHVHSAAGSHSLGTYRELIQVSKELGFDYLFVTEHPKEYQLFNPLKDPEVVMIYGWEDPGADGFRRLRSEGWEVSILSQAPVDAGVPERVTGVEIFNIAESAGSSNNLLGWGTWLYHQPFYPELFFFHAWRLNQERIEFWNRTLKDQKLAGFAGNNAHQNVGFVVVTGAGDRVLSVFVDPYMYSLAFVTNHLFVNSSGEVDEAMVLDALSKGASYMAFERMGDPEGFSFHALSGGEAFPMGSTVPAGSQLVFQSPVEVRFRLLRSGSEYRILEGRQFILDAVEPGAYRLEVYLLNPPALVRGKPWILSNPIYVEAGESS